MKILIIGGSRFVGPVLLHKLVAKDHRVTVFNRGQHKFAYPANTTFVRGDREEGFNLGQAFDVVIDMCAYSGAQTRAALEQISYGFFIHFGTAAAYAKSQVFPLSEESPLGEWPAWGDYNRGKVECERELETCGKDYATIRPVYILGPANYVNREHFIYSRINAGQTLTLPGNGQALSNFVFAQDVADILILLAEKQLTGAYNCACDEAVTLLGLVEEHGKLVGKEPVVAYNPAADGAQFSEEEFPFANENFVCTNSRVKDLGFKFTPFLVGLQQDFESYYRYHL